MQLKRLTAIAALAGHLLVASAWGQAVAPVAPNGVAVAAANGRVTGDAELPEALADLRISELTLARIEEELRALRLRSDIDFSVLDDYAIYRSRVQAMVEGHRSLVRSLRAQAPLPADVRAEPRPIDPILLDPLLPEAYDELSMLDRELDEALTLFDAFILEEQYEARRRRERSREVDSEEMTNLAREAAAAVERLREKGIEVDTSTPPPPGGEGEEADSKEQSKDKASEGATSRPEDGESKDGECEGGDGDGGSQDAGGDKGGGSADGTGAADGSGSGAGGVGDPAGTGSPGAPGSSGAETPTVPPNGERPPTPDDDIVARQLREAAEKETDPVLKEKLWEEYDKYKQAGG